MGGIAEHVAHRLALAQHRTEVEERFRLLVARAGSAGGTHRSSTRTASNGATPATVKAMGQPYCSASTPVMNSETLEPTEKLAV